jgi:hypothetical protein
MSRRMPDPKIPITLFLFFCFFFSFSAIAQVDSSKRAKLENAIKEPGQSVATVDTAIKVLHSPRKAAIRSAIIPGWGQIYNKKYWKLPIIYAALGITTYIFVDNLQTYKDLKLAYLGKYNARVKSDSTIYFQIKPQYLPIQEESLRAGRDQFRRYVDYSVVFFVVFWGLNVVDAVVDAHLKAFDVSPDLTLKFRPSFNPMVRSIGLTSTLAIKDKPVHRKLPTL